MQTQSEVKGQQNQEKREIMKLRGDPSTHGYLLSIQPFLEPITAVSGLDVGDMMGRLSVNHGADTDREITTHPQSHIHTI